VIGGIPRGLAARDEFPVESARIDVSRLAVPQKVIVVGPRLRSGDVVAFAVSSCWRDASSLPPSKPPQDELHVRIPDCRLRTQFPGHSAAALLNYKVDKIFWEVRRPADPTLASGLIWMYGHRFVTSSPHRL
jgi:hypothetical protein